MLDYVLNTPPYRNIFQNKIYDRIYFKFKQNVVLSIIKDLNL